MTAMHVFVFARTKRKIEQLQREREATELQYRSYLADLNDIATELSQHGITLETVPIDPNEGPERQDRESNG